MLGAPDKLSWKSNQKSNQRFQKVGIRFDLTLLQKLDDCALVLVKIPMRKESFRNYLAKKTQARAKTN
jgi:hypothetical protein